MHSGKRKRVIKITINILICLLALVNFQTGFQITLSSINQVSISEIDEEIYNIQLEDTWTHNFGKIKNIIIENNLMYLTGGDKEIFILNISKSNNPTIVTSYNGNSKGVTMAKKGSILFIALQDNTVDILDVQNLSDVKRIGSIQLSNSIKDICVIDNTIFFAQGNVGIDIWDIENTSDISYLTTLYDGGSATKIEYKENLLFVADGSDGLEVFNTTNQNNPLKIGNFTDGSSFQDLVLFNDAVLTIDSSDYLKILAVSNITNIKKLSECFIDNPKSIVMKENYSFITHNNQVTIINCTDLSNPTLLLNYTASDTITTQTLKNNFLYLGLDKGLEFVEIQSFSSLHRINKFGYYEINTLAITNELLFISLGTEGLVIFDITTPTSIIKISNYTTTGNIVDISVNDNFLYLIIEDKSVEILNIENPYQPTKVGEYLSEGVKDGCIRDSYLFLAAGAEGLKILDISNINTITQINNYLESYFVAVKLELYENNLFVFDETGDVSLFDYTEIIVHENEIKEKAKATYDNYVDVAAMNDFVYLSTGNDLVIIDITNPNDFSKEETYVTITGVYRDLVLTNNLLYVLGLNTIQILDITDPNSITKVEYLQNDTYLTKLAIFQEFIAISNVGFGDDLFLFTHKYPTNFKWYYIAIPVGGVILLVSPVIIVVSKHRKKKESMEKNVKKLK